MWNLKLSTRLNIATLHSFGQAISCSSEKLNEELNQHFKDLLSSNYIPKLSSHVDYKIQGEDSSLISVFSKIHVIIHQFYVFVFTIHVLQCYCPFYEYEAKSIMQNVECCWQKKCWDFLYTSFSSSTSSSVPKTKPKKPIP